MNTAKRSYATIYLLDGNAIAEPSLGWTKTMAQGAVDEREEDVVVAE